MLRVSVSTRGCGRGRPPNSGGPPRPVPPCCLQRRFPSMVVSYYQPTLFPNLASNDPAVSSETQPWLAVDAATVGERVAGLLLVVEPLGSDPQRRNADCKTARLCCVEPSKPIVTRCDNATCRCLFPSYPGTHTHTDSQVPGQPRATAPAGELPAVQKSCTSAASTCRLSAQADGTASGSLSPAPSHHHSHGLIPELPWS